MCSIIFSLEGSGRGSVTGFEGPGKIERIGITAGKGRIFDGKTHFQETAGPVSYTHLDVYKRQIFMIPNWEIRITELNPEPHLKLSEMIGYALCAA